MSISIFNVLLDIKKVFKVAKLALTNLVKIMAFVKKRCPKMVLCAYVLLGTADRPVIKKEAMHAYQVILTPNVPNKSKYFLLYSYGIL